MNNVRLFIFGLGYSAGAFARAALKEGAAVAGTTRDADKAARLKADGVRAFVFDGDKPGEGIGRALGHATHVLVSIAPGEAGDVALAHHADDLRAASALKWLGYLSTVGVYGDHGGAWVDEATPPSPASERSRRRLAAEEAWREFARARGVPLALLRLAGIYGPGRNAFVNLAEGKAHRIVKPGQVFNRIHVDDIALALTAAVTRNAEGVFNLSDNEPAPPQDVVAHAAHLMGMAPPPEVPFDKADLSPMARSFYEENKRVANGRLKRDLDVTLRYPTYREGLAAMAWKGTWR